MISYKKKGEKSFLKGNFKEAILFFSLALEKDPNDEKSKIFALLADFALENEDEAVSIFDLLYENKENKVLFDIAAINSLIDSISTSEDNDINDKNMDKILINIIEGEDGISFEDFLKFVEKRKSFSRAYEDISFSTKIFISKKEDLIYFLELLIQNGYKEQSLKHIENALQHFREDVKFYELLLEASKDTK